MIYFQDPWSIHKSRNTILHTDLTHLETADHINSLVTPSQGLSDGNKHSIKYLSRNSCMFIWPYKMQK
jgi:hypothetical protein